MVGKAARWNLTPQDGPDEHLLRPLRVLGSQDHHVNVVPLPHCITCGLDGVWLIGLDGDDATPGTGGLHGQAQPRHHVTRPLHQQAVIGSDVGFAFGPVYDDSVHREVRRHRPLDVGGKARPPQSDHAGFPDGGYNLCCLQVIDDADRDCSIAAVVRILSPDHYRQNLTVNRGPRLYSLYPTRNTAVNGC